MAEAKEKIADVKEKIPGWHLIEHLSPEIQSNILNKAKILRTLVHAFPYAKAKITNETLITYGMGLTDLSDLEVQAGVLKCLRKCTDFFPTIATIREQAQSVVQEHSGNRQLNADEAWHRAIKEVKRKAHFLKPEIEDEKVAEAVRIFGWAELHMIRKEDVGMARAQFKKIYEGICSRDKDQELNMQVLGSIKQSQGLITQGLEHITSSITKA